MCHMCQIQEEKRDQAEQHKVGVLCYSSFEDVHSAWSTLAGSLCIHFNQIFYLFYTFVELWVNLSQARTFQESLCTFIIRVPNFYHFCLLQWCSGSQVSFLSTVLARALALLLGVSQSLKTSNWTQWLLQLCNIRWLTWHLRLKYQFHIIILKCAKQGFQYIANAIYYYYLGSAEKHLTARSIKAFVSQKSL